MFGGILNADCIYNELSGDMKYIVLRKNEDLVCPKENRATVESNKDAW